MPCPSSSPGQSGCDCAVNWMSADSLCDLCVFVGLYVMPWLGRTLCVLSSVFLCPCRFVGLLSVLFGLCLRILCGLWVHFGVFVCAYKVEGEGERGRERVFVFDHVHVCVIMRVLRCVCVCVCVSVWLSRYIVQTSALRCGLCGTWWTELWVLSHAVLCGLWCALAVVDLWCVDVARLCFWVVWWWLVLWSAVQSCVIQLLCLTFQTGSQGWVDGRNLGPTPSTTWKSGGVLAVITVWSFLIMCLAMATAKKRKGHYVVLPAIVSSAFVENNGDSSRYSSCFSSFCRHTKKPMCAPGKLLPWILWCGSFFGSWPGNVEMYMSATRVTQICNSILMLANVSSAT